jgi:hypothetical protein
MSDAPYRIVVLGADAGWADEVVERCSATVGGVLERPELLAVERRLPPAPRAGETPPQTLVLFLNDAKSRDDETLLGQAQDARAQLIPVLPLFKPGGDFTELPELLQKLNALPWDRDGTHVAGEVARLLGIAEIHRRLFLSYKRLDSTSLALQLREHLSRRTFDVFLDRFSVPPAADFQQRLNVELADKAFVLLLESRTAAGSEWVQHEVAYALSHGISLLALSLSDSKRFPTVDDAFRMPIDDTWLIDAEDPVSTHDRVLEQARLEKVLDVIETRYARQMRQRRTSLLGSLEEWLHQAGRRPEPLSEQWALIAHDPDAVFLITPGAPLPGDLKRLDALRDGDAEGYLLYAAPVVGEDDDALIEWITDGRLVKARPYLDTPNLLGI